MSGKQAAHIKQDRLHYIVTYLVRAIAKTIGKTRKWVNVYLEALVAVDAIGIE